MCIDPYETSVFCDNRLSNFEEEGVLPKAITDVFQLLVCRLLGCVFPPLPRLFHRGNISSNASTISHWPGTHSLTYFTHLFYSWERVDRSTKRTMPYSDYLCMLLLENARSMVLVTINGTSKNNSLRIIAKKLKYIPFRKAWWAPWRSLRGLWLIGCDSRTVGWIRLGLSH